MEPTLLSAAFDVDFQVRDRDHSQAKGDGQECPRYAGSYNDDLSV
jgi:hypothetical protein